MLLGRPRYNLGVSTIGLYNITILYNNNDLAS